jgi:hypothetical protein
VTLAEQIGELRMLVVTDPDSRTFDLVLIYCLDELCQAVQELGGEEPRGLGSV